MKFILPLLFAALCGPAFGAACSITGVVNQTVGDTAVVTASGGKNNTTDWTPGVVGNFYLSDGSNTYGLRVSVTNPTGSLTSGDGSDSLMVARTVNSQGLADTGTLSIYFSPGSTAWSADISFSFYNVDGGGAFTTPYSPTLLLTSLDIDANQRYYTDNADFSSNFTYAPSNLTTPSSGVAGYTGFTAAGNASFSDPSSAVSSVGVSGVTDFDVQVAHTGVALFMFEFRDPSQVLVPEPSTALLGGIAALALLRRRRAA